MISAHSRNKIFHLIVGRLDVTDVSRRGVAQSSQVMCLAGGKLSIFCRGRLVPVTPTWRIPPDLKSGLLGGAVSDVVLKYLLQYISTFFASY